MFRWVNGLVVRLELWIQRNNQIAEFDGIALCELRPYSPTFKKVLLDAFALLKESDPRRFARVKRYLKWVINGPLAFAGCEYRHSTQTCVIDYAELEDETDLSFWIAWYASALIHEATHALLLARGIPYSSEFRVRAERLCVTEENRFARRIAATQHKIAERLHREFDESLWHRSWNSTRHERARALFRRLFKRRKEE
jgi:hypothetical protein